MAKPLNRTYQLIDTGDGRKLERFGPWLISRPASQAVWKPSLPLSKWEEADAIFSREGDNHWLKKPTPWEPWTIEIEEILFKLSPTDFGHLGIFPEHCLFWKWMYTHLSSISKREAAPVRVLNLFAYSGGATLAAAKAGAHVCHLDASKGMVSWARENAQLNHLEKAPIRWIVDDVSKFLSRELRRGSLYEAIILDPPSFGRGSRRELFKIEEDLPPLLDQCRELLSDNPLFVILSCHTPGFSPLVLHNLLSQCLQGQGQVEAGEMLLEGERGTLSLPCGTYARWTPHAR
jgi:23S rRNA (cytosine1962-C5)-methyltransferase